jgi:hypothetical protein
MIAVKKTGFIHLAVYKNGVEILEMVNARESGLKAPVIFQ